MGEMTIGEAIEATRQAISAGNAAAGEYLLSMTLGEALTWTVIIVGIWALGSYVNKDLG